MNNTIKDLRLAVLIDADNVPYAQVKPMMEEIAKYGTPTFKRIYADWTKPTVSGWKRVLLDNAITPIQQYSYSKGKNSSDSAMIIDAMDILYSGKVDGFCIVSSDSDFTRLAIRLREAGMTVIGLGERKTLPPFITACDKFIYLEILKERAEAEDENDEEEEDNEKTKAKSKGAKKASVKSTTAPALRSIKKLITDSIKDIADETGWVFLGDLGNFIIKRKADFDPRNFGFQKLLPLIKSLNNVDIDERETGKGNIRHIFVKVKEKKPPVKKKTF